MLERLFDAVADDKLENTREALLAAAKDFVKPAK